MSLVIHRRLAIAAAMVATTISSHAELTVYTNLRSFRAATIDRATDQYSNLPLYGKPIIAPLYRDIRCGYSYEVTNGPNSPEFLWWYGSTQNPFVTEFDSRNTLVVSNISGGATAIGANLFDAGTGGDSYGQALIVTATDADGTVTQTVEHPSPGTFVGFVSSNSPIVSLTTSIVQDGTVAFAAIDNLVLGKTKGLFAPAGSRCGG